MLFSHVKIAKRGNQAALSFTPSPSGPIVEILLTEKGFKELWLAVAYAQTRFRGAQAPAGQTEVQLAEKNLPV